MTTRLFGMLTSLAQSQRPALIQPAKSITTVADGGAGHGVLITRKYILRHFRNALLN